MNIEREVLLLLDDALSLQGRGLAFTPDTPLLGTLPELDSMAVLAVIHAIEERFCVEIPDDEIDGSTFISVGSLVEFVGRIAPA